MEKFVKNISGSLLWLVSGFVYSEQTETEINRIARESTFVKSVHFSAFSRESSFRQIGKGL